MKNVFYEVVEELNAIAIIALDDDKEADRRLKILSKTIPSELLGLYHGIDYLIIHERILRKNIENREQRKGAKNEKRIDSDI